MSVALARHDDIVRSAVDAQRGYVFSTAGDAFAVAFDGCVAAVRAAIDVQRALQSEDWPGGAVLRVRMGVHAGEAVERDGDYFGPTVNQAARVMAAGHGGQLLVTAAVAHSLDGVDLELWDLGEHRLRDIDRDVRLFQVMADGLVTKFPPVRSLSTVKGTLPSQRSSLVGRDDDVARIRALLPSSRLITLTGAGGCGKTRLAIEAAERERFSFADGAFFVDLARIGDDEAVAEAFAIGIDFVPDVGAPISAQVCERVGAKPVLLVVDNCEHVLDGVAEQIDGLLASCPNVRILATSREALDVDGEQIVRVQSLGVDSDDGPSPAIRLFIERASEAGADVHPDDDAVIADICRRLDGLPLAIELAAARTGVLSPGQILERLDDRFTLLTGGRRRSRGRQQTLEAAIDWSYDLLDPADQEALRRLSVPPAAFDLDLAAAILDRTSSATVDALEMLTARSLVYAGRDDDTGTQRYRLLETIRAYAYQRLVDAGDAEATRDRHAAHVADRLERIPDMPLSMEAEHFVLADDALMAIDWVRSRHDVTLGARLVCGAYPIFIGRGLLDRGDQLYDWVAAVGDPVLQSKAFLCRAGLALAANQRLGDMPHFARLSLRAAGDLPVPWRARAHSFCALSALLIDEEAARREIAHGYQALEQPGAIASDRYVLDLWVADLHLWRREYGAAVDVAKHFPLERSGTSLADMNLYGCSLLASMLADDREGVARQMADPVVDEPRAAWLVSARRGEHWLLSYEAIRAAALGYLGEPDRGRHELAQAHALLDGRWMQGVEEDFLASFAWLCLCAGEGERAEALLDDTWELARSPNTIVLLMEAYERSRGIADSTPLTRAEEILRRVALRDVIIDEGRRRHALDSELQRVGLTRTR
jgi:predicted ATPase